ncbi:hypothetical protein IAR55_005493 [Kwoniella newhampshirensis]|uniref:Cytochrome P450 n=1 Tax=Kwoniella newhampshirensis TaxID=1651941 RepID=A0AAW0YWG1_9TREE
MSFSILIGILILLSVPTLLFLGYIRARPIPGIPYWPDGHILWGDIPRLDKAMKEHDSVMWGIDETARALGPISQLRLGPLGRVVIIADLQEIESLLLRRHASLERDSAN